MILICVSFFSSWNPPFAIAELTSLARPSAAPDPAEAKPEASRCTELKLAIEQEQNGRSQNLFCRFM